MGRDSASGDELTQGSKLANGEVELPPEGDESDAAEALEDVAVLEGHSRPSSDPTDPAAPRPEHGSSSQPADG
jgi:hypothetical protein